MINGKKILSVVTARGGSKGIPKKNVRFLGSHPLFTYSVFASLESRYVDMTVISSDCPEVEKFTRALKKKQEQNMGILTDEVPGLEDSGYFVGRFEFIQRPEEISGDLSKNEAALSHAYYYCKDEFGFEADLVLNLQPTSPIRNDRLIDKCIERMIDYDADSLFTGTRHTPFFFKQEGLRMRADWDIKNRPMRQEILYGEWIFHDDGSLYLMTSELLLSENCRLGGVIVMQELDKFQALQIDEEMDFKLIELLLNENINIGDYYG